MNYLFLHFALFIINHFWNINVDLMVLAINVLKEIMIIYYNLVAVVIIFILILFVLNISLTSMKFCKSF